MTNIPERFREYHEKCNSLSIEEMVCWLKQVEPEFEDELDSFMRRVNAIEKDNEYPYPKDWRIALENTGISRSLLYMKNTLRALQDNYNEHEAASQVPFLSKIWNLFFKILVKTKITTFLF